MEQEAPFNGARFTGSTPLDTTSILAGSASTLSLEASVSSPRSEIQGLLLKRLKRLVRMEADWRHRVPDDDWRLRLIHKVIYSTYCDCVAEKIAAEASQIVSRGRSE
jgi:hypothetical protein